MDPKSPNFRDGRIEKTTVTPDYIDINMSCAAVEGGELRISISPHPEGWIHIHFSGLGSKVIKTVQTAANGVDIRVKV